MDDQYPKCRTLIDLFSPGLVQLRDKGHQMTLQLVKADLEVMGAKAVDVHWRKIVYETVKVGRGLVR